MVQKLFRIRNARLFLIGDVVSTLGDNSLWLAMAIWVKELTGGSAMAGLVIFCYALGNLSSPLGGVIADRYRRRPLLIWANLLAAVAVLSILFVHGRGDIWIIYAFVFCYGVIGSAMGAAQTALVPAIVPAELLPEANGAQQTMNEGLRLVTPLVGAGLFSLAGGAVVAVADAATFLVAAACLLLLKVDEPAPARGRAEAETPGSADGGMASGFRFLLRDPVLRTITATLGLALLTMGFTESAGYSIVTQGLHHSASFVGVLNSVQGVTAVIGGLVAARLLRRMSEPALMALALGCATVAVLLLALPNLAAVLIGMLAAGFAGPWMIVSAMTALQRRTPGAMLGRVSGAFQLSLTIPQVTSIGLGAALIAFVSYRVLLVVIAVVCAAAVAFCVSQPATRQRGPAAVPPEISASAPDSSSPDTPTAPSPR